MKWLETISIERARELQKDLRKRVRVIPLTREPRYVAGVDAAFSEDLVYAAACLYRQFDIRPKRRRPKRMQPFPVSLV